MGETLILSGISQGTHILLRRNALWWRQIDLASKTGLSTQDVSLLEHDRAIPLTKANRVLAILDMRLILPGTVTSKLRFCKYPDSFEKSLREATQTLQEYIKQLELELGINYNGITEITKEDISDAISKEG